MSTQASKKSLGISFSSPKGDRSIFSSNPPITSRSQLNDALPIPQKPSQKKMFKITKSGHSRVAMQSLSVSRVSKTEQDHEDDSEYYRKKLAFPLKEEFVQSGDEHPASQVIEDDEIAGKFYNHYRKLDRISEINEFNKTKDGLYTSFLKKSVDLKILPSKIGFIAPQKSNNKKEINLNYYRLGDKYAAVLSEGLKTATNFNKFELSHNRLTGIGADLILSNMSNQVETIDLSGNNIGKMGIEHLCKVIRMRNPKLMEVNLQGNKLGDYALTELCEALTDNDSIVRLNLSKNLLTNKGADLIGKMLQENNAIEELYLSWNQIKAQGGIALLEGMKVKSTVRVLDLSWNSLGLYNSPFAQHFSDYISKDKTLVHLDLSNNYFNKTASLLISKGLEQNHTLYGFHFHGNVGYVDPKGFLIIPDNYAQDISLQVLSPQLKGSKVQPESIKRHQNLSEEFQDVCWICEGWRPIEVKWTPGSSGSWDQDPTYVHFSYEGYKGRYLPKDKEFKTCRMAPPIAVNYLFSVDEYQIHAEDQETEECSLKSDIKIFVNNHNKVINPEFMNKIEAMIPKPILDEDFKPIEELIDLGIKPRIHDEEYIPPEIRREKPAWKFPVSIFRDYRPDNHALLDKCFEVDFENTRITKLVKNADDLKAVRELLHGIYKNLKDCYKHFAAIGAPSEIWSIPLNTYTDFCSSAGIIDGKVLKLSDFDRIFIATYTKTEKEKNPRNPDRALVRYQFMEGLVRIADQKYINTGMVTSYPEALKLLLQEHVVPYISKFDHQKWRVERYWVETVDAVVKSYLPILKGVYKKYSGLKTLPGQRKFMSLEEFHRLLNDSGSFNDNCGDRDATLSFNIAMMTQADELDSDRIFQMQFIEFVEALSRIADKYSPAPYGKNEIEMSYEERSAQSLAVKLEGFMPRLFEVSGSETKEIWVLPETSIFNMEESHGKQRFTTKKKKLVRLDPTDPTSYDAYDV